MDCIIDLVFTNSARGLTSGDVDYCEILEQ